MRDDVTGDGFIRRGLHDLGALDVFLRARDRAICRTFPARPWWLSISEAAVYLRMKKIECAFEELSKPVLVSFKCFHARHDVPASDLSWRFLSVGHHHSPSHTTMLRKE